MEKVKGISIIAALFLVEMVLIYQALSVPDFDDIDQLEAIKIVAQPIRKRSNSSLRLYDGKDNYHLKCDLAKPICEMDGIFDVGPIEIILKRFSFFDYVATEASIDGKKVSVKISRVEYISYKTGQWFFTLFLPPILLVLIFSFKNRKL